MAYKIKIKHNVEGKSIPLTLKYTDESVHFPNISVNLTDTDKVVTLSGWGENEEGPAEYIVANRFDSRVIVS